MLRQVDRRNARTVDVHFSIQHFFLHYCVAKECSDSTCTSKESSLHPPSKVLFRCLATTDFCVGLFCGTIFRASFCSLSGFRVSPKVGSLPVRTSHSSRGRLYAVFLTITTISVDRPLALLLGLKYRRVVTFKRTYMTVVIFWSVSFVAATSYLANHQITIWYGRMGIPFCVVTSMVSYLKIFLTLRRHQTQVQDNVQQQQQQQEQQEQQQQPSQASPLNIARYRKAVFSALWVKLTLVACSLQCRRIC